VWWEDGVVYQVYPFSFQDGNGDGIGDLPGVIDRLDYPAETLGVDAVWLSPFYRSPMDDFGYDVADYCDVDPIFGSLGDAERLIAEAHRRGLRVILDFVPNHSSSEHPWFVASRSSRSNPKRDWYTWRDPAPGGGPPNNWLSVFGGPAWEWDEATGQYYLHSFLASQPDLNWRNPEVRRAMYDAMRFWLDRGADGFRFDVVHYVMKDPGLRDDPVVEASGPGVFKDLGEYDSLVHLHDKGHPDVHEVLREIRRVVDAYPGRYTVGEIHVLEPAALAAYYGRSEGDGLHMPFNFTLLYAPWEAAEFRRRVDEFDAVVPAHGWPNYVLGNHDEPRLATRFGPGRARVAMMLLLTLRGTPTIYYGDELGLPEVEIPPERQQDPWGLRVPGLGRDGCRTPMPWDRSANAGFCPEGVEPWLPQGPAAAERSVAAQLEDPSSMLNLVRHLLRLRRREPALHRGEYRALDEAPEGCYAFLRSVADGGPGFVVALNFTDRELEVPGVGGEVVADTGMHRVGERAGPVLALGPDEGVVVAV
jgi:alpha-glucosidase